MSIINEYICLGYLILSSFNRQTIPIFINYTSTRITYMRNRFKFAILSRRCFMYFKLLKLSGVFVQTKDDIILLLYSHSIWQNETHAL